MIKISYNSEEEMMKIQNDKGDIVFYGNLWDFSREPKEIAKFLNKLGLKAKAYENLPPIG